MRKIWTFLFFEKKKKKKTINSKISAFIVDVVETLLSEMTFCAYARTVYRKGKVSASADSAARQIRVRAREYYPRDVTRNSRVLRGGSVLLSSSAYSFSKSLPVHHPLLPARHAATSPLRSNLHVHGIFPTSGVLKST